MEEQEVRNFLRGVGEELTEVPIPTINLTERDLETISDSIEAGDGLDLVIKNLGTISNAFKTENDYSCGPEVLTEAVKVIYTALAKLHMEIAAAQGNVKGSMAQVDRSMKHKYRKYMAVIFFLIHKSFEEIERAVTAESHNISIHRAAKETGKRKKRQTDDIEESKLQFWFYWRPKILQQLWKVITPPMDEIWENNPNPDGHNFLRCLTLALCTTIKNKSKSLRNMDAETEDIFDILGVLISKHSEESGIIPRLIPLLKGSEETANIIANGIDRMLQACPEKAQEIVMQALTESFNVYAARYDKESVQERGFYKFLTQLCALQPKAALNSLAVIIQFLDAESQIVRNAVLVIAQELMNTVWAEMQAEQNNQTEDGRRDERKKESRLKTRQRLLDEILLKYMKDVNSLVRSKAINLLSELAKEKAIVPAEAVEIMKHVKLRLLDKTVTTRKAATTLVVDLVKMYPHIVRPAAEFERKRNQKLAEICATIRRDENDPAIALYFIIKEFFLHIQLYGFTVSSNVREKVQTPETALALIEQLLKDGEYWQACEALHLSIKTWTDEVEQLILAMKQSDNDTPDHLYIRFFKATHSEIFPQNMNSLDLDELNYIPPKRVEDERDFLAYIQSCLKMQFELDKCQPSLKKLLELGTTTDKKEAVMFFAAICDAGYKPPRAITISIINALAQLNAEELPDFVEPFKDIFIGRENRSSVGVVKKLTELIQDLSEGSVESLSGMIGQLYKSGILTGESLKILWDAFSLSTGGWDARNSRSAAYLLGIIGQIERKVVTSNLNQLIDVGLGQRGLDDFELAKVTLQTVLFGCRVEQQVAEAETVTGKSKAKAIKTIVRKNKEEEIKFPPSHDLFTKIVALIELGLQQEGSSEMNLMYPRVVELCMQIIYRMCTQPSEIISRFLPNIHGFLFATPTPSQSQEASTPPAEVVNFNTSEKLLFRYMSFGKALLGAHIIYYEQIVSNEIKERKIALEKAKKKSKNGARPRSSRMSMSVNNLSANGSLNQSNQDAQNAEMDVMIGNIGFDAEADNIKSYVGGLLDSGFFRQFRVHVLFLCQNFGDIKSLHLKVGVVQALAKLMLVCEASVVKSLDVLMKLWNGNEPFAVKLEILRASIRLTVKFPNQMEKMNDCFSAGLAHEDSRVRKACMDYIEYLALSDLLKIREQMSDTAACLCDKDFELREMARDFINQIAEKDNVLQNCIPDIISRLSGREDISQENFQMIMKTLLSKIKKEKQLGGLVERIIIRFRGPATVRVCQDTAFCLTQIQQNDRTFKILKDNFNHYSDKLADEQVWNSFMEILNVFKKVIKSDSGNGNTKMRLDEWEKELEDNHAKCVATDNAEKAAKRKHEKPQRRRMEVQESSSDEEDENAENHENENNEDVNDNNDEEMAEGNEGGSSNNEQEQMDQSGDEKSNSSMDVGDGESDDNQQDANSDDSEDE